MCDRYASPHVMQQYVRYENISMSCRISSIFVETYLDRRRRIPIVFDIFVDMKCMLGSHVRFS